MTRLRHSPRPRVPAASYSAKQRFAAKHESPHPRPGRAERPPELDRVIHERMRLAIVSALAANPSLSFRDLKSLLSTTDGNLSVHARKLEDAGYVAAEKSFENRMPKTEYHLTAQGRRAFERYLNHLEALIGRDPREIGSGRTKGSPG